MMRLVLNRPGHKGNAARGGWDTPDQPRAAGLKRPEGSKAGEREHERSLGGQTPHAGCVAEQMKAELLK
jgi:hypothetical protein